MPITARCRRSHRTQISAPVAVSFSQPVLGSIEVSQPRGQKRVGEEHNLIDAKRQRRSNKLAAHEESFHEGRKVDPIDYWRRSGYLWPQGEWTKNTVKAGLAMSYLLARKKSTGSLRRKRSDSGLTEQSTITPSDQGSREAKSAPYRDARYETLLATKGSYMDTDDIGIIEQSKALISRLLEQEQQLPQESLFRDDIFETTCRKIRNKNETRVIRDISLLIVPSAENMTTYGASELACLTESVNEGWNNSIPVTGTRPQPDYAAGFRREAFTDEQLQKLQPFVGELTDQSYFMATYYLYFPFLTCEVKCGAAALDVADRQNAHSMTLAIRAVVELFRLVKREKELDREVLGFSVSHDHRSVRIYGHYPVTAGSNTTFFRYAIHEFSFTALEGKDKWTTYKFVKSVYRTWMPAHFARLCSVIDALPANLSFELSQQSELRYSEQTGLSQDLADQNLSPYISESALSARDDASQTQSREALTSPNTSFTKDSADGGKTKAKRGAH